MNLLFIVVPMYQMMSKVNDASSQGIMMTFTKQICICILYQKEQVYDER